MNTVKVRNLELGNGIPAICIPNVGKTKEDILSLTRTYLGMHMDLSLIHISEHTRQAEN